MIPTPPLYDKIQATVVGLAIISFFYGSLLACQQIDKLIHKMFEK